MRAPSTITVLIALAAALACGSSTEPDAILGTWYLQSYNDSAMPGTAWFRSGNDSSLIAIDSVRLVLEDGSVCAWLVQQPGAPTNSTTDCVWSLDADPDDLLVTILASYTLRGDASASALAVRDPRDNLLVFGRDPAERGPIEPTPRRQAPR